MGKIDQAITAYMREATIRLLNQGFAVGYKSRYLGHVTVPRGDGRTIAGHVWRVQDLETGEAELIVLQDSGGIIGFQD